MSILGKVAAFEPLRSIDSATFTGSYQLVGTVLTNPSVLLKIVNNSTVLVTVSYNGVADHDVVPAGAFVLYDFGSDAQSTDGDTRLSFPAGTGIYVKASSGTGSVYVVSVYVGR